MGREILYRAQAINRNPNWTYRTTYKDGDWVYGLVSRYDNWNVEMTNEVGISGIDVDRNSVCEYTGLTDKNNQRIFENDIVSINPLLGVYVVKWNAEQCKFSMYRDGLYEQAGFNTQTMKEFEVIGNIYDNSKLLKKDKSDKND